MRFNDAIVGLFLSVLAIMVLFHVETFPSLPLHDVGPATFPRVLAWALLICSVYLILCPKTCVTVFCRVSILIGRCRHDILRGYHNRSP